MKLLLDTNVLARLCHPTSHRDVKQWFAAALGLPSNRPQILVSVLGDYELRRTLLEHNATASLLMLDRLGTVAHYLPITLEVTKRAAQLRKDTAQLARTLSDADLIMAAQAQLEEAVLVTSDALLHKVPGLTAKDWDALNLENNPER